MTLFKCKMCGGTLEIAAGESVATCEYCSTQQTLPKLDDEKRANMYDRANHFRRNNEFDKATGIYEQILNEDNTDAEAYWSLVLCRYGIEYVEDPASHKRIPTVNRAQFTSVFDDDNYKSALQYADGYQKAVYEEEAKAINEIQKGILAISQKEEPFDVFICYKESDNSGRRTPDSVLANDLYHQLTQEGFKVFFARITLEDKLGSAYEPYIFAALNSSKVMVVLGTKPEYFNAVWVKNEWSRYLALIKNGAKKMLIPAYKDMDPYDLPEEFSHLQAQDMGKLGFMQDLIRGIKKITATDEPKATVVKETVIASGNANTAPLLERVFMFLEDGDWGNANEYCEKVLDIDPKCAEAYVGKLMAELWVHKQEDLKNCEEPFDDHSNYQKAIRFADDSLKNTLIGYIDHINTRNENTRLENLYQEAARTRDAAKTEKDYQNAAQQFEEITAYKDAAVQAAQCLEQAEIARKDAILSDGKAKMTGKKIANYEAAIAIFKSIPGWKDADEQIPVCQQTIVELQEQEQADKIAAAARAKKAKKMAIIAAPFVAAAIAVVILLTSVIIPNSKYNNAIRMLSEGQYESAYDIFENLEDYKDAPSYLQCTQGIIAYYSGDYVTAYESITSLEQATFNEIKLSTNLDIAEILGQASTQYYSYEDTYNEFKNSSLTIAEAENMLSLLPDNFKDVAELKSLCSTCSDLTGPYYYTYKYATYSMVCNFMFKNGGLQVHVENENHFGIEIDEIQIVANTATLTGTWAADNGCPIEIELRPKSATVRYGSTPSSPLANTDEYYS